MSETNPKSKVYDPKEVERSRYAAWLKNGNFRSNPASPKKKFAIMIPPPNVTGVLHMGHVLNLTIQDILSRRARMQGKDVLWQPGMDHAGIATQTRVEKTLKAEEGKSRHDLGREAFVERVWEWKEKYGGIIFNQFQKLGLSCDWERSRFTMDDGLSLAVRKTFVDWYKAGLIYRGNRIINWCPASMTALSDEEVIYKESKGKLYYFNYPLADGSGHITVATTRPETMLGDVAVAVNPADDRYKHHLGKLLNLPLTGRQIPVIADDYVDAAFGTGAVKITPAHDPNDYEIGKRHQLPMINIMNPNATLNDQVPAEYIGLDRFEARKKIVADFEKLGFLNKIEDYDNKVGYSERADVVIEPRLSDQWFVKMEPLAAPALEVVRNGDIRFYPDRWTKTYEHWMTNIKDWCISRQLWWGHRIPVWYCQDCGELICELEDPKSCTNCSSANLKQDEDVLDTWFSSQLWPFSTLDWPKESLHLKEYYPTDDLVTGPDIIFFWVARMIMSSLYFTGKVPFRNVYFTGIIRDKLGRKMSKSLGNSPEPLDLIDKYGTDGLRVGILMVAPQGTDIHFDEERLEQGRNFSNKIWNAYRFLSMFIEEGKSYSAGIDPEKLDLADKWMLHRLQVAIESTEDSYDKYRMNEVINAVYDVIWSDFCDWYIELIKPRLYGDDPAEKVRTLSLALHLFESMMKLLHPYMPFITEEVWQSLRPRNPGETILYDSYPVVHTAWKNEDAARQMEFVQKCINSIRNVRVEMNVPPGKPISLHVRTTSSEFTQIFSRYKGYFEKQSKVTEVIAGAETQKPGMAGSIVVDGQELFIPMAGLIDVEAEKARLQKEIDRLEGILRATWGKLNNPGFVAKAPESVIVAEKEKAASIEENLGKLKTAIAQFG